MKTNVLKSAGAFLLGIALLAASCEKPMVEPEVEPAFPEKVTETIAQGESCEITLSANKDWELEMTGDLQYFRMIYNGEPSTTIEGKEGEFTVKVEAIEDASDFEQRHVTLTMKMEMAGAPVEQVVAEVHRNGTERIFKVYPAKIEDDDFVYGENGYEFESEAANDFSVIYYGSNFLTYLKVEANFDWALKEVPEWVDINVSGNYVSSGKANETAVISLRGINSKFPLDGDEGELVFIIDDEKSEEIGEYTLSIPEIRNMFLFEPLGSMAEFNAEGEFNNAMGGWVQTPLRGSFTGIQGAAVYMIELGSDGYLYYAGSSKDTNSDSWIKASLSADKEDVLASYDFSVSVSENTEPADRKAIVLLIPGTVEVKNPEWFFITDDEMEIKEEYQKYIYTYVVQRGAEHEEVGELVTIEESVLTAAGAQFAKADAEAEWVYLSQEYWGVGSNGCYELTVTNPDNYLNVKYGKEFWDAGIFELDTDTFELVASSGWCEPSDQTLSLNLDDSHVDKHLFIVCKTENPADMDNPMPFAVIKVIYNPGASVGEKQLVKIAYPASTTGISLRKMNATSDAADLYYQEALKYLDGEDQVYEYVQGKKQPTMPYLEFSFDIDPEACSYPLEDEYLSYESAWGNVGMILMNIPTYMAGMRFGSIMLVKDTDGKTRLAMVCIYDPEFGQSAGGDGGFITANDAMLADSGASFGKMKDNANYADMMSGLVEYFGVEENELYVLTVSAEEGAYYGFSFAEELGGYGLYEFGENGIDMSESSWAEVDGSGTIVITLDKDDYSPKYITIQVWNEQYEMAVDKAVICVSRE